MVKRVLYCWVIIISKLSIFVICIHMNVPTMKMFFHKSLILLL